MTGKGTEEHYQSDLITAEGFANRRELVMFLSSGFVPPLHALQMLKGRQSKRVMFLGPGFVKPFHAWADAEQLKGLPTEESW